MQNKNLVVIIIVLIIVGLGLVTAAYFTGVSSGILKNRPEIQKAEKVVKMLSSKTITLIDSFGKVTKISDRTITLTQNGESLDINIEKDAPVYLYLASASAEIMAATTPKQSMSEFKNIKVGDNLNITMKVSPDGQIGGISVTIIK